MKEKKIKRLERLNEIVYNFKNCSLIFLQNINALEKWMEECHNSNEIIFPVDIVELKAEKITVINYKNR
ncbi:MAG: hypothetical protein U9P88_02325 [Patescibacteria group bacterium]|nr:hypothetical protein [Patescibacteria group bacterium]